MERKYIVSFLFLLSLVPSRCKYEYAYTHSSLFPYRCSGLTQLDYFQSALDRLLPTPETVKQYYGSIVKREELEEDDFVDAVFVCKHGYLSEVRVCFDKADDGGVVGDRVSCPDTILREDSCGDEIKIASFDDGRVTTAIE